MSQIINKLLDVLSDYLAHRKGLIPLIGIALILANWILQLLFSSGWVIQTNLFLHLGIVIAVLGLMLAWAL